MTRKLGNISEPIWPDLTVNTWCLKNMSLCIFNNNLNNGWSITVIFATSITRTVCHWTLVLLWLTYFKKLSNLIITNHKPADIAVAIVLRCYIQHCNCGDLLTYYSTSSSHLLFFKSSCQTQLCTKLIKVYSTTHIGLARIEYNSNSAYM